MTLERITVSTNELYFRDMDDVIRMAGQKGMYVGLLPTWEEAVYGPGEDRLNPTRARHPRATRCAEGSYAFVYIPLSIQAVSVDLTKLFGTIKAQWYDPRNGQYFPIGEFANSGVTVFTTPIAGPDWVLVLDAV